MDGEMKRAVEAAVLDILRRADMETATEQQVRAAAAERLGIDLSTSPCRLFVRTVLESFLLSSEDPLEREEQAVVPTKARSPRERKKEYCDTGELILCRLSSNRLVTLQVFKGRTLVSIREFYEKEGKQMPSTKGISLTVDQWKAFKNVVPAIEDAIQKMEAKGYKAVVLVVSLLREAKIMSILCLYISFHVEIIRTILRVLESKLEKQYGRFKYLVHAKKNSRPIDFQKRGLFQYIQGANLNFSRIAMTAPILTSIVPNAGPLHSSAYFVRLYLPVKFQASPPTPLPELHLHPDRWVSHCVAVRKFSGFARDSNIVKEAEKLAVSLSRSPWANSTDPSGNYAYSIAQYNSPFRIIGRVNEVWTDVVGSGCESRSIATY